MKATATAREMARPSRARVIGAQLDRSMMSPQFARGNFGVLTCALIGIVALVFTTERASFVMSFLLIFSVFCVLFYVGALLVQDETSTKLNAIHRARINEMIRERDRLAEELADEYINKKTLDFGGQIWVSQD